MQMIFEENIERIDFLEFVLSSDEVKEIFEKGLVQDFSRGLYGKRNLNVFIRIVHPGEKVPFKSRKQQAFLFSQEPEVAKEFAAHTSKEQFKKLPNKVKKPKAKAKK